MKYKVTLRNNTEHLIDDQAGLGIIIVFSHVHVGNDKGGVDTFLISEVRGIVAAPLDGSYGPGWDENLINESSDPTVDRHAFPNLKLYDPDKDERKARGLGDHEPYNDETGALTD